MSRKLPLEQEKVRLLNLVDTEFKDYSEAVRKELRARISQCQREQSLHHVRKYMAEIVRKKVEAKQAAQLREDELAIRPKRSLSHADHVRQQCLKAGTHFLDKDGHLVSIMHKR